MDSKVDSVQDDSDGELYGESVHEGKNIIVITNKELADQVLNDDNPNFEVEQANPDQVESDSDSDVGSLRDVGSDDDDDDDDINVITKASENYETDLDALTNERDEEDDVNVVIKRAAKAPISASGLVVQQSKTTTTTAAPQKVSKTGLDLDDPGNINGFPTIDFNISTLKEEEKGWKLAGADIADFFNFGFNEDTWIQYCNSLKEDNINGSANVIVVNSAIRMRTIPTVAPARSQQSVSNGGGAITVLGASAPNTRPVISEAPLQSVSAVPASVGTVKSTPMSTSTIASTVSSNISTLSSGGISSSNSIPTVTSGNFPSLPSTFNQPPPGLPASNFSMPPPGFFPPGSAAAPSSFLSVPPMMPVPGPTSAAFPNTALPPPGVLPPGSFNIAWQLQPTMMSMPPGFNPDMPPPPREATPDSMKSGEDYSQFDPSEAAPSRDSRSRRDKGSRSPDNYGRRERRTERRRQSDKHSSRRRSRSPSRSRSRKTPKHKYKYRERSSSRSRSSRRVKSSKRRSRSPKTSSRYKRSPDSVERSNERNYSPDNRAD